MRDGGHDDGGDHDDHDDGRDGLASPWHGEDVATGTTDRRAVPWLHGPPVVRHALDAVHVLPPLGERWLVAAVTAALPEVRDPALRRSVLAFLAEEAAHARAHEQALEALVTYRVDLGGVVARLVRTAAAARRGLCRATGRAPAGLRRGLRHIELAVMVAMEASTAAFGEWVLGAAPLGSPVRANDALQVIRWHAADEVAHRDVVPALYAGVGASPAVPVLVALPVALGFHLLWVIATAVLGLADRRGPALHGPRAWRRARRLGLLPGPGLVLTTVRSVLRRRRPASPPGAAGCRSARRAGCSGA